MIPDERQALALHAKHGSSERVVSHCRTVTSVSEALADAFLAKGKPIDRRAVVAGALLHDIGRSKTHEVGHLKKDSIDSSKVLVTQVCVPQ